MWTDMSSIITNFPTRTEHSPEVNLYSLGSVTPTTPQRNTELFSSAETAFSSSFCDASLIPNKKRSQLLQDLPFHHSQKKLKSSANNTESIQTSFPSVSNSSSPHDLPKQSPHLDQTDFHVLQKMRLTISLLDPTTRLLMKEGLTRLSQRDEKKVSNSEKSAHERQMELNLEKNVLFLLYGTPDVISPESPRESTPPRCSPAYVRLLNLVSTNRFFTHSGVILIGEEENKVLMTVNQLKVLEESLSGLEKITSCKVKTSPALGLC
eukprot:TRINITY_DN1420_c0_g1_i1.p1 TRINITY_DN1420_c0_g1~~TRINITY_DN1420_c0_g1_i1.p1  ORF type:complete len:265 (-),score=49.33 TRINITY_DN1420_c0_g1_i1:297-1091(-)